MKIGKIFVVVCCLLTIAATPTQGEGPITVGETEIVNDYPEIVTFEIKATSTAATITSVDLHISIRGDTSISIQPAEFEPGQQVEAGYEWKTRLGSVPPGAPIQYWWVIKDEAGNTLETEPTDYIITDARFTWHMLESETVVLWWYAGDAEFGQRIFDAATQALKAMEQNTGLSLSYRVHVVLYENREDFDSWHYYPREWVAGQAFPGTGLTVQIIPPGDEWETSWHTQGLIPHEVAHLFFHQAVDNPLSLYPHTWINEGFAQYHEFVPHEAELAWVRRVGRSGNLIPLRLASGTFSGDDSRIALLYAESLSAVTFIFERWDKQGMEKLLTAFGEDGCDTDEALIQATGLDFEEFQEAWWEWLGGEAGTYPTPLPTIVVPTFGPPPTADPSATETPTPTAPPIATPTITPSPTSDPPDLALCTPCVSIVTLLGLLTLCGWRALVR
jgi:hypothetical protein